MIVRMLLHFSFLIPSGVISVSTDNHGGGIDLTGPRVILIALHNNTLYKAHTFALGVYTPFIRGYDV